MATTIQSTSGERGLPSSLGSAHDSWPAVCLPHSANPGRREGCVRLLPHRSAIENGVHCSRIGTSYCTAVMLTDLCIPAKYLDHELHQEPAGQKVVGSGLGSLTIARIAVEASDIEFRGLLRQEAAARAIRSRLTRRSEFKERTGHVW